MKAGEAQAMSERTIGSLLGTVLLCLVLSLAGLVGYLEIRGNSDQWQPKNCHHH